jgi:transcriptional regulator
MYLPSHFNHADLATALRLMTAHPFASVISIANGEPFLTHCPLVASVASHREGKLILHGHLAKQNPHHELWRAEASPQVTAVFQGPHGYVSPNWYAPENSVKAVPTWNYTIVHARGEVKVMDDAQQKDGALKTLIGHMEPGYAAQWRALPEDYQSKMLSGIVAFDIIVSELKVKLKLSQNRPAADKPRVIEQLQTQGETQQALAQWMREINGIER